MSIIEGFKIVLFSVASRYFIAAGLLWLIYYVLIRKKIAFKKIQLRFPESKDYKREIGYSFISMIIFAGVPSLVLFTPLRQYTQYYADIHAHSMLYFWLAFPLMFILHDTYFYWIHRAMHHPRLFKLFHLVHHKSTNPSPWAAYSFHPLESASEAFIFVILVVVMPITKIHLGIFFGFMILYNVYGHLGWEIYPKGFSKNWFGKWINTSVNHNQHHQYFKGNYGLYFLFWDRIMGTIRADYDTKFEEVKGRIAEKEQREISNKKQGITNEEVKEIFNAQHSMSNVQ
ncbi:MAG: sterol desaturase family protein [Filimonas sp.]|nr:sterol desaturase family protein [Filimonas sp.]